MRIPVALLITEAMHASYSEGLLGIPGDDSPGYVRTYTAICAWAEFAAKHYPQAALGDWIPIGKPRGV